MILERLPRISLMEHIAGCMYCRSWSRCLGSVANEAPPENIRKQVGDLKDFEREMLLPGMRLHTSPTDDYLLEQSAAAPASTANS